MAADSIVLVTGVIPLVLVAALRAVPMLIRRGARSAVRWYELALAQRPRRRVAGGSRRGSSPPWRVHQAKVGTDTALGQLQHGSWVTLQAFLEIFGANIFGATLTARRP